MNFLKKLLAKCCAIFQNHKPINNPTGNEITSTQQKSAEPFETFQSHESVSRFIFSSSHFNSTSAKAPAFMPAPDGDLSVYRNHGLSDPEIWEIDRVYVTGKRTDGLISKARADVSCSDVWKTEVKIEIETSPHPRHANITAYASIESEMRSQALQLATASTLSKK